MTDWMLFALAVAVVVAVLATVEIVADVRRQTGSTDV